MPVGAGRESFPEAAMRHYRDAISLLDNHRLDNGMCHLAFSAECVLKAFREVSGKTMLPGVSFRRVHNETELLEDIAWCTLLNPKEALLDDLASMPPVLFEHHPDRRYYGEIPYTAKEIQDSQTYTEKLVKRLLDYTLDHGLETL